MAHLEDIQAFMRVVEAGGISAAAERLGVAKSVVSRRLTELEARLGVQLLRRTTRRINLTDTGRGFYDRCQRILADLDEAEAAVALAHGTLRGRLRVAAPLSFGLLHLGAAICEFMRLHPQVRFDLDFNDRPVDLLSEDIDVAIRITQRLEDSSLIARRLWSSRVVICASPAYLRERGTPATPEDLIAHDGLVYGNVAEPTLWTLHDADGREYRVPMRERLRANNGDFLRQAALAGEGIVYSPRFIVYDSLQRGELTAILPEYSHMELQAHALYPQTRHLSQRVRAFVDFLAERYAGVPCWDRDLPW